MMNSSPPGTIPGFYIHRSINLQGRFRVPYPQKTIFKEQTPATSPDLLREKPLVWAKAYAGEATVRNHRCNSPMTLFCPEWRRAALAALAVLAAHAVAACIAAAAGKIQKLKAITENRADVGKLYLSKNIVSHCPH